MNALRDFAEQLVDEACGRLGATPDPATREQMILELESRADSFLNRRLIDAMTEDSAERFEQLLDEPTVTTAIVQAFIAANVPDVERVAARALVEFRRLYLRDD